MVTRDFGQTANVKGSRDALRVDKAVGNHVDSVSIAILAKPESRDKRSGKSRAFQCDASTTPLVVKTNDRGTCCSLLPTHFPTKIEQMSNIQPNVQAISSSTQTTGKLAVRTLIGQYERGFYWLGAPSIQHQFENPILEIVFFEKANIKKCENEFLLWNKIQK